MLKVILMWGAKLFSLLFLLYALVNIVGLHSQIAAKEEELDTLKLRVKEYAAANEELREKIQDSASDADIGDMARSELGYASPGERIFVDTSGR